jgi:hypothetical protein
MLETPHVAIGAAIATKIPNPLLAIPLAFASHFILDRIPHWNPHSYTEIQNNNKISQNTTVVALIDVGLSLGLGFFVASRALPDYGHAATIITASFASVSPDLIKSPFFLLGVRNGWIKKWVDFERSLQVETENMILGLSTQALLIAAALWWILGR